MEHNKEWYVQKHREMWNWIADQIENEQCVQDIFFLKRDFCRFIDEHPKSYCFSCQYDMDDLNAPHCRRCLFDFGGSSNSFSCEEKTSVYYKCTHAETWQEQAKLARTIANLPVRENIPEDSTESKCDVARQECENKIEQLMREIVKAYKQYKPDGEYISMFYMDGCISCNNETWVSGNDRIIEFRKEVKED